MPLPTGESELSLAYQLLPVMDEQSIPPSITTRESEQEFFRELLRHLTHAIIEPEWLLDGTWKDVPMGKVLRTAKDTDGGFIAKINAAQAKEEDSTNRLIIRSLELLTVEHPGISFWRGGSYKPKDLQGAYTLDLPTALLNVIKYSSSTVAANQVRSNPVLIQLSVDALVLNYRLGNAHLKFEHRIEGLAASVDIGIPRCDEHTALYFRPPAGTAEQQEAYLQQLSRKAEKLSIRFF